jgi:hypothetical protein
MAKIRFTTSIAFPRAAYRAGDEAEFSAADATRLIASGVAVPVAGAPVESAVLLPAEARPAYQPPRGRRQRRAVAFQAPH